MDEEGDGSASTPFWLQSRRNNTNFRRTSSFGGRTTTVTTQIIFAGTAAVLIVFFIIPPIFSSVSQIFRPHLVRKSWDYLNFFLVLFAVLCGFLSRNTDNDETDRDKEDISKTNEVINGYGYNNEVIDRGRVFNGVTPSYYDRGDDQTVYKRFSRLRSSSSYPNLRLRDFEADERWRFYDDTNVRECRYEAKDRSFSEKVEVFAAAEAVEELPAPSNSPPPSLSPPSKPEKKERAAFAAETHPMTPIQLPATVYRKSAKQEKKKGGATKDFIIALRRKKKKQRQQSIDGLDLLFGSDHLSDYSIPPNPPPPPPPPPPFFQGLFSSKKGKTKRAYSNPPPPPPPPPERSFKSRASIAKIRKTPVESHTAKVTQFTGSESPLMPIPLPPPPPPFKMPAWKFVKRGDYVRMASNISISSDEPDDPDVAQSPDSNATGSPFCPNPDVDTKADDFIARFRAGLKLEKMNSVKRGRSNLRPDPGSDEFGS